MPRPRMKLTLTADALLESAVHRHIEQLQVRNLRPNSVNNRLRVLRRLAHWAQGPILYLSAEQLSDWQRVRSRSVQPQTLRMEMSGVREFYGWCVRERLRHDDPSVHLDMPRVPRRLPRPMLDADLALAMVAAPWRIEAILSLAAFAGLRACEIARLDWSEVTLSGPNLYLTVTDGKGGRGRNLPISSALADVLLRGGSRRGPVITRIDGQHGQVKPHRISSLANEYLHEQGVTATLHQCRHRFATATYAACRDIRAVQELMGHSSPTTTAIYAAVSPDVAVAAVEAAGRLPAA